MRNGGSVNNSTLLFIAFAIVVFGGVVFWKWRFNASPSDGAASIQPAVTPTGKTVLSGTPPHEMSGKISEELRKIAKLPDSGWAETHIPIDLIKKAYRKSKSINAFSVLNIRSTFGKATKEKTEGIDQSWRGDFIRPDKIHVSQSLWDVERGLYGLDEWVTLGERTFVNAGLWGEMQDLDTIDRLSNINNSLLPETVLSSLDGVEFDHTGRLNVGETSYAFLQTGIREEQGIQMQQQVWIDEKTEFVRKYRLALYEENTLVAEEIVTFMEHSDGRSIAGPEWLNMDSANTIVNTSVCIVEHW